MQSGGLVVRQQTPEVRNNDWVTLGTLQADDGSTGTDMLLQAVSGHESEGDGEVENETLASKEPAVTVGTRKDQPR